MLAHYVWQPIRLPSTTRTILLPDNDQITLEVSTPKSWQKHNKTIVLLHGLCGSADSWDLIRIGQLLYFKGYRVMRMNMRGCGSGEGLARKIYHSGRSEDLLAVCKELKVETPNSPITVVAFSLGGNVALKFAGESPNLADSLLQHVIAICPSIDLLASSRMLGLPQNRLYAMRFLRELKLAIEKRHRQFPELPLPSLPEKMSFFQFDQLYTAPQNGFQGALEYYRLCSANRVLPNIRVPTTILFAEDDPFIDWTSIKNMTLPSQVDVRVTNHGGHLGFLGSPLKQHGFRWMDHQVEHWIK